MPPPSTSSGNTGTRLALDIELSAPTPWLAYLLFVVGSVVLLWAMFSPPGELFLKLIVGFLGALTGLCCGAYAVRQQTRTVRVNRQGIVDSWLFNSTSAGWERIGGVSEVLFDPVNPARCWAHVVRDRTGDRLFWLESWLTPRPALEQVVRRIVMGG